MKGGVSRVTDFCREQLVFDTLESLNECLSIISDDAEVNLASFDSLALVTNLEPE